MLGASETPDGTEASEFDMAELAALIEALPDDGWIVERTISSSPYETTQIVHRDKGVVASSFVRKIFAHDAGLGAAYQRVLAAQTNGKRFEHLPVVYDMVEADEGVSVVTEFVRGETVRQYVEDNGSGTGVAIFIGRGLCDAMCELHESFDAPIVHRDLKPSNIMMADGTIMLIDLGIARAYREGGTRDTVRFGTPGYAPPEQFGYGQTTPQSDIYAAGMVMAFCLIGQDPTPALRESGFDDTRIPQALRGVLTKATALDATQRYANAREMRAAIDQAANMLVRSQAQGGAGGPVDGRAQAQAGGPVDKRAQVRAGNPAADRVPISVAQPSMNRSVPNRAAYPQTRAPQQQVQPPSGVSSVLGTVWNVVLVLFWLFFTAVSVFAAVQGDTEFLARLPLWFRFFSYGGMVIIPGALLVVLLSDKRRLRERYPALRNATPRRLVPLFLIVTVALYFVTIVIYGVMFNTP